jgi:DNA-binding transcriptional MerR regulator
MAYTVGEVARLSGISVRALHHYDEVGLVKPSGRTKAGYRLYTKKDLLRLQQVLFYRELGFKLEDILTNLDDPAFDRRKVLLAQRALLAERAEQARALVALIDCTLHALDGEMNMNDQDLFDGFDPSKYEDEVKERWGHTDAYAESQRRTSRYTKDDWRRMGAEAAAINESLAKLAEAGVPPTDARAMDFAEVHRLLIDRWFYPCSSAVHVGLGDMYVADPRFAANYDKVRPGLAQYLCDAIRANSTRGGVATP